MPDIARLRELAVEDHPAHTTVILDKSELRALLDECPTCGHEWRQHDPEDGKCDAHSGEPDVLGACRCGREIEFHREANARLSRTALEAPKAKVSSMPVEDFPEQLRDYQE